VDTSAWLAPGIKLHIPVVAANMDTVTETRMAIAMAQQGGIGILHRFMTVSRQVECVRKVKRAENLVVKDPIMISDQATLFEARVRMADYDVSGLLVVDDDKRLVGILTSRDLLLTSDSEKVSVKSVMTPRERMIVASADETVESARERLHAQRIEKLPLVDENDHVVA
jgi:IMP dehydrogenase